MSQQKKVTRLDNNNHENFDDNESFIENVESAVLLSLLKKGLITKRQFDLSLEKLRES